MSDSSFWFAIGSMPRCSIWARSKYRHSESHTQLHTRHTLTLKQSAGMRRAIGGAVTEGRGRAEVSQLNRQGNHSGENHPPSVTPGGCAPACVDYGPAECLTGTRNVRTPMMPRLSLDNTSLPPLNDALKSDKKSKNSTFHLPFMFWGLFQTSTSS